MNDDARYAAMVARDRRFDGVFFVAVRTTGIYCRPICPARTPGRTRCEFFATAARAEAAGYRACFRCRPEVAPGNASVDAVDRLVQSATRRIAEGALNDTSFEDLAGELGVSDRHLRRAIEARLGVSPVELAQSQRLALAKQLLHDTHLSLAQIAFAAGFGSVRRFNAVFAARMGSPPSAVRPSKEDYRQGAKAPREEDPPWRLGALAVVPRIALRLDYRPPYDWARLVAFLRDRAIPGVEAVGEDSYRRIVHLDGRTGTIEVRPAPERSALELHVAPELLPVLMPLVARVRRMFDLDARPDVIGQALRADKILAPMIAARPGLRVPGAIDPFEAAVRALLGQQVSVAAATTLAGRFAERFGERVADGVRFPTVREVVAAGAGKIVKIGMPKARATAIHELARALDRGAIRLDAAGELDDIVSALVALPGIGPWTAHYLAMRALHLPDAFPAADLGVQKALGRSGARAAETRAEAWRPFRAYAVLHLWTDLSERTSR